MPSTMISPAQGLDFLWLPGCCTWLHLPLSPFPVPQDPAQSGHVNSGLSQMFLSYCLCSPHISNKLSPPRMEENQQSCLFLFISSFFFSFKTEHNWRRGIWWEHSGYRRSAFKFSGQPHTLRSEFRRDGALQLNVLDWQWGISWGELFPLLLRKCKRHWRCTTLGFSHLWYQGCVLYEISETTVLGQTYRGTWSAPWQND